MGPAAPWGQSLLRSCLAAHSFPPPPPLDGASPGVYFSDSDTFERQSASVPSPRRSPMRNGQESHASLPPTREARPQAGGGGGKECAARHERSNDWPQGGAAPITRKRALTRIVVQY